MTSVSREFGDWRLDTCFSGGFFSEHMVISDFHTEISTFY